MNPTHTVIVNGETHVIEGFPTYADLVEMATGSRAEEGYTITHRTQIGRDLVKSGSLMPRFALSLIDGMVINVART